MYCIKCGVELADSEKVCPLCGTRVFHPDLPCGQAESPYPPDVSPRVEDVSRAGVLFVLTVLFKSMSCSFACAISCIAVFKV